MPDSWTAIDFETANQDRGSACAVGLVKVRDGVITDRYTTLIRPPAGIDHFSPRNTAVHGITPADVATAPTWRTVHARIMEFADGDTLVAHNAPFDMGVIAQASARTGLTTPAWTYTCTLALSRRTWTDLPDHRLPTVSAHIGHRVTHHHRADADAEAAARIAIAAMEHHGAATLADLARATGTGPRHLTPATALTRTPPAQDRYARFQRAARTEPPAPSPDADPAGPLYGRVVCVSGDLDSMDKPEVWRRIAEAGGTPAKNVTKKTDILVIGGHDGPGKTSKHRRAETYAEHGQPIAFLTEADLLLHLGMTTGA